MPLMPESPRHLLLRGDRDAARASLAWLKGGGKEEAASQLKIMEEKEEGLDKNKSSVGALRLLRQGRYRRPFLMTLALMFLQQFSGINAVVFYAQTIFSHAGSAMDPGASSTLVSLGQVLIPQSLRQCNSRHT